MKRDDYEGFDEFDDLIGVGDISEIAVSLRMRRGAKFLLLWLNAPTAFLFGKVWFSPSWLFVLDTMQNDYLPKLKNPLPMPRVKAPRAE